MKRAKTIEPIPMNMLRHAVSALALIAVSFVGGIRSHAAESSRPNIIFIVADDMGYADTGFQGCTDIATPHLDALARSGVRCTSGYASHPFCSPSRASLMTGRYQQRFGHENNPLFNRQDTVAGLPLAETLLPKLMRDAGYATGWIGKWHLGAAECFHPLKRGFAESYGFLGGGHQYFADKLTKPDEEYFTPLERNGAVLPASEGYLTTMFGGEACAFVERHAREPFFLYLAFNCPHAPLQAPPEYLRRIHPGITDKKRRAYAAMVMAQDDAVGLLMAKLAALGLEEKTLVCFISDNGGPVGYMNNGSRNGALRGGKFNVYEGGIRVPFVLRWKGMLPAGRDYAQPVMTLDLTATALALAGGKEAKPLDGVNLIPFLRDEKSGAPHEAIYWRSGGGVLYAVRSGALKLVRRKDAQLELYDLDADIGEQRDIAAAHPADVQRLDALRAKWDAQLVQPLFPPLVHEPAGDEPIGNIRPPRKF